MPNIRDTTTPERLSTLLYYTHTACWPRDLEDERGEFFLTALAQHREHQGLSHITLQEATLWATFPHPHSTMGKA